MREIQRRIRTLEARQSRPSTWDFSRLTDDDLDELIELYERKIEEGKLLAPDQRRFELLSGLIVALEGAVEQPSTIRARNRP